MVKSNKKGNGYYCFVVGSHYGPVFVQSPKNHSLDFYILCR